MGALRPRHTLTWHAKLAEGGTTCWELRDERGCRWGWIVNAGTTGWLAHIGDWGQADDIGVEQPPVTQRLQSCDTLDEARSWVDEGVAADWRTAN